MEQVANEASSKLSQTSTLKKTKKLVLLELVGQFKIYPFSRHKVAKMLRTSLKSFAPLRLRIQFEPL